MQAPPRKEFLEPSLVFNTRVEPLGRVEIPIDQWTPLKIFFLFLIVLCLLYAKSSFKLHPASKHTDTPKTSQIYLTGWLIYRRDEWICSRFFQVGHSDICTFLYEDKSFPIPIGVEIYTLPRGFMKCTRLPVNTAPTATAQPERLLYYWSCYSITMRFDMYNFE